MNQLLMCGRDDGRLLLGPECQVDRQLLSRCVFVGRCASVRVWQAPRDAVNEGAPKSPGGSLPGNLMLTDEGTPTLDVLPDRGRQPGRPGAFDLQGLLIETFNDWKERSGHNVYPAEIEGIVNDLPAVLESAVIGVPHPDFGEVVVAVVVAKDGCVVDAAEVINTLKSKIANFKVPKQVFVVSELPRNTMGKVQKNLLRDAHKGLFGK